MPGLVRIFEVLFNNIHEKFMPSTFDNNETECSGSLRERGASDGFETYKVNVIFHTTFLYIDGYFKSDLYKETVLKAVFKIHSVLNKSTNALVYHANHTSRPTAIMKHAMSKKNSSKNGA